MDVKVGDVVHVQGTVTHVGDGWANVHFDGNHARESWTKLSKFSIVHVEPRPLAVGDKVTYLREMRVGTVVYIHRDWAWVDYEPGSAILAVVYLTRVEP